VNLPACGQTGGSDEGGCVSHGDKDSCSAAGCSWDPGKSVCN
jgi:hypothetical protein